MVMVMGCYVLIGSRAMAVRYEAVAVLRYCYN